MRDRFACSRLRSLLGSMKGEGVTVLGTKGMEVCKTKIKHDPTRDNMTNDIRTHLTSLLNWKRAGAKKI